MLLLDAASNSNPGAYWWLKGDGCDKVTGLRESVRLEWSGDVDLDTGELQQTYTSYRELLGFVDMIGIGDNGQHSTIVSHLQRCLQILKEDKEFILKGIIPHGGLRMYYYYTWNECFFRECIQYVHVCSCQ